MTTISMYDVQYDRASPPLSSLQWNLDITNGQGTGKICSLKRCFVIWRFFFICFTSSGVEKIVRYVVVQFYPWFKFYFPLF